MHPTTFSIGTFLLALTALTAHIHAFHVESGTTCPTANAPCKCKSRFHSYSFIIFTFSIDTRPMLGDKIDISDDSSTGASKSTVVDGFCASNLICASNGAKCSSDDQCYNYCGEYFTWCVVYFGLVIRAYIVGIGASRYRWSMRWWRCWMQYSSYFLCWPNRHRLFNQLSVAALFYPFIYPLWFWHAISLLRQLRRLLRKRISWGLQTQLGGFASWSFPRR